LWLRCYQTALTSYHRPMAYPQQRGSRIAFFGGSFDPPHHGHLAIARAARLALNIDTVLFAPVGTQPLKPSGSSACFSNRLEMTRLAINDEPGFELSMADAPKPEGMPNFTLETLLALSNQLPSGGQLFCLMGADAFAGLRHWHRAAEIPFAASLIVASRPGESMTELSNLLPEGISIRPSTSTASAQQQIEVSTFTLHNSLGESAPFYLLPGLAVDISATQIRELLRSGKNRSQSLLPIPVFDYIRSHGLYC
jgi:nicotinate-nucleotide adenylyltransferase